jgi:hypothetical protein
VTCKDGRGGPAECSLFARSEMWAAVPAFQATKRRSAGIGGVILRQMIRQEGSPSLSFRAFDPRKLMKITSR